MFDQTATQEQVFDLVAKSVIDKYVIISWMFGKFNIWVYHSCLEGYNGTIFAYGQVRFISYLLHVPHK